MRRVILESPYAAPDSAGIQQNLDYARACLRDCLQRGEAPIASHLLYTQPGVLDDKVPEERELGIEAGLSWADTFVCEAAVFYTDRGWSSGMMYAIDHHRENGTAIEERTLPGYVDEDRLGAAAMPLARHLCDMPESVRIALDFDLAPDEIKVGLDLWKAVLAVYFDHDKAEA